MSLRGYCLEKEDEKPPRSIDECLLIMNSEVRSGMIRCDINAPLNRDKINGFYFLSSCFPLLSFLFLTNLFL